MGKRGGRKGPMPDSANLPGLPGDAPHVSVLLAEVLQHLAPRDGGDYIDATFGAGGYSRAILEAADCRVLGLDRDLTAVRAAAPLCQQYVNRLTVVEACFGDMEEVARVYLSTDAQPGRPSVFTAPDGIVLDIGVSSMQLDQAERGFSFQHDGALDMRMSQTGSLGGRSAADIVNTADEKLIADILYQLGEERRSRAIAGAIVRRRDERPFERTGDLAAVVERVLGRSKDGKHPATRTFQALRLYVNDELGQLARGLVAAERLLKPGGRLVVVAFHSLEDRIVKQFLSARSGRTPAGSRHAPLPTAKRDPSFRLVNPKAVVPGDTEVAGNPRARSAKLRAAERTAAEPWPFEAEAFGLPEVGAVP